jgi:uncharacterized membrane protein
MYEHHHFDHGGFPFWEWLLPLLLIALLVAVAVWAILRLAPARAAAVPPAPARGPDPALQELRLRYARGEVSPEDFARISADLGAPVLVAPHPPPPEGQGP